MRSDPLQTSLPCNTKQRLINWNNKTYAFSLAIYNNCAIMFDVGLWCLAVPENIMLSLQVYWN